MREGKGQPSHACDVGTAARRHTPTSDPLRTYSTSTPSPRRPPRPPSPAQQRAQGRKKKGHHPIMPPLPFPPLVRRCPPHLHGPYRRTRRQRHTQRERGGGGDSGRPDPGPAGDRGAAPRGAPSLVPCRVEVSSTSSLGGHTGGRGDNGTHARTHAATAGGKDRQAPLPVSPPP
eukprot:COSAG02_NODE_7014_length_3227_cov_2.049552_4_plen_173_part_01